MEGTEHTYVLDFALANDHLLCPLGSSMLLRLGISDTLGYDVPRVGVDKGEDAILGI